MQNSLIDWIRSMPLVDRVRWACTLEATSPKLGNVHPSAQFSDLNASDFTVGGNILAESLTAGGSLGEQVLRAVQAAAKTLRSNANLGICLLIAPLYRAEQQRSVYGESLPASLERTLRALTPVDSQLVFQAIRLSRPGGLGTSSQMDVQDEAPASLLAAMQHAEERDRIARQYARNFEDVFQVVIPSLTRCISRSGDLLWGIRQSQIEVLAQIPDSLIARKCGIAIAAEASRRAAIVLDRPEGTERIAAEAAFDQWLRADANRRNPGTTADLLAAGLFLLFCSIET